MMAEWAENLPDAELFAMNMKKYIFKRLCNCVWPLERNKWKVSSALVRSRPSF